MYENSKAIEVRSGGYGHGRVSALIEIGKEYEVLPLNPRRMKHRGRICTVLAFVPISEIDDKDHVVKVRFKDNNRIGRVEFTDLILSAAKRQS